MHRATAAATFTSMLLGLFVGCGSKDSGPGGGGDKPGSYTQRILDLDPALKKEFGVKTPKNAKALFAPGSVEDLVQSLTLFNIDHTGQDVACTDTQSTINGQRDPTGKTNELNGITFKYQASVYNRSGDAGGVLMKQKCWDTIYGPQQSVKEVNESTGADRRFGGGGTVLMNHWTLTCKDETVLLRGMSPKSPLFGRATKDEIRIFCVNFNKTHESICPKQGEFQRGMSFKY